MSSPDGGPAFPVKENYFDRMLRERRERRAAKRNEQVPVCFSVGELIRIPRSSGGYRIWRINGVFLGGERQENVVSLETLDLEPHDAPGFDPGVMLVPEDILYNLAEKQRREGGSDVASN